MPNYNFLVKVYDFVVGNINTIYVLPTSHVPVVFGECGDGWRSGEPIDRAASRSRPQVGDAAPILLQSVASFGRGDRH